MYILIITVSSLYYINFLSLCCVVDGGGHQKGRGGVKGQYAVQWIETTTYMKANTLKYNSSYYEKTNSQLTRFLCGEYITR